MIGFSQCDLRHGNHVALPKLTLAIHDGERVAVIGPSGAGKSTLLNALHQQIPQRSALCPQQLGLVDILSVYHNIYMGQLDRHGAPYNLWNLIRPIPAHRRAIHQLAQGLGLESLLDRSVDSLSGGQRQRVALGRALYRRQPVFFGDEPVSSLDAIQGRNILEAVLQQHQTAVVTLHNRHHALQLFDRVIGLKDGVVTLDSTPSAISQAQLQRLYAG